MKYSVVEIGGLDPTKGCEGVHDEVDPEKLDDVQRRLSVGDRSHKGNDEGNTINGQLELKELAQIAEDTAAPQYRLDDTVEVIVHDDNVSSFLGNLRSWKAVKSVTRSWKAVQLHGLIREESWSFSCTKFPKHRWASYKLVSLLLACKIAR